MAYRSADAKPKAVEYQNESERDAADEARYNFDREGDASITAFVASNQVELALQYLDEWRERFGAGRKVMDPEAQRGFEQWRFGAHLSVAPAGVLRQAIHRQAFRSDFRRDPLPLPVEVVDGVDYRQKTLDAIAKLTREARWPSPMTNRAIFQREQEILADTRLPGVAQLAEAAASKPVDNAGSNPAAGTISDEPVPKSEPLAMSEPQARREPAFQSEPKQVSEPNMQSEPIPGRETVPNEPFGASDNDVDWMGGP